ncbi:MAG TPA: rod shape-determining protein MreD [Clostridiaceae bacterium]|nr:rod shape-determining protein MreD [Clostridiaceae bacterium]
MKRFVIPLIILMLVGIQNSLFENIRILGVKPDIALTFVICYTFVRGNPEGTVAGILCGLFEDIFFAGAFGINSIGCMITTYLIGSMEGNLYKDNIFIPGIFTFIGSILKECIVMLMLYLTRNNIVLYSALTKIIIPEAIYNTIIVVLFFKFAAKISSRYYIMKPGNFIS